MSLGVCAGCRRFARPNEACPFCGGNVGAPMRRIAERKSRAGVLAATAAIALACGGTTTMDKDAATDAKEDRGVVPVYGAPPYGVAPMPDAGDAGDAGDSGKPNDGGTDG